METQLILLQEQEQDLDLDLPSVVGMKTVAGEAIYSTNVSV